MIYLDNAATTKPYQEVVDTFLKYENLAYFNPSSVYKLGRDNNALVEKIKENILNILNLKDKKVVFTSSATEANNLAILGYLMPRANKGYNIITTNVEHKSVLNVFKFLENNGFEVRYLHLTNYQKIDINELKSFIDDKTIFVSAMAVNNETGAILNIDEIYDICVKNNITFHSDFSQALFKTDKSLLKFANIVTISSHKIHGLKSIAALIMDKNIILEPQLHGGNQEYGMRSSTVDVPLIASFYKAIEINNKKYLSNQKYVSTLFDYLFERLSKLDYVDINSLKENSTKYILDFSFKKNIKASVVVEGLSNKEIYVSSTSACNSKSEPISYVIDNIYHDLKRSKNTVRVSFSEENTIDEIDILINTIDKIVNSQIWEI